MRDRIKNIVSSVLKKFTFEPNLGNVASVLKHQIEIGLDSVILAEYSVNINQSVDQQNLSGSVFFKENHEANTFQEIQFQVSNNNYNIN